MWYKNPLRLSSSYGPLQCKCNAVILLSECVVAQGFRCTIGRFTWNSNWTGKITFYKRCFCYSNEPTTETKDPRCRQRYLRYVPAIWDIVGLFVSTPTPLGISIHLQTQEPMTKSLPMHYILESTFAHIFLFLKVTLHQETHIYINLRTLFFAYCLCSTITLFWLAII